MTGKHYSEEVPEPTRFEALAGPWAADEHDNWPGVYEVSGSVEGEEQWEWADLGSDSHRRLRAAAIERVPAMIAELVEAYDLLLVDISERRGEDRADEHPKEPDRTERLGKLVGAIGGTLRGIEERGEILGLDAFGVLGFSGEGYRPTTNQRFASQAEAHRFARALSARALPESPATDTAAPDSTEGPEYVVAPAHIVEALREGDASS